MRTRRRGQLLALIFSLAPALLGGGVARADYVGNKYTDAATGEVLEYNVFVPTGYDATKKYPLMVFLHAANNTNPPNRTLSSDGVGWTGTFINTPHQTTDPSFFMIPISQTNMSGWGEATQPISTPEKFEGALTIKVLKSDVMTKYSIDPNRLYITGPSMGGRGTWDILRRYPGMFAAAAPAAAPASPDDAALYLNENIWAICGEVDPIVQGERDAITAIRKLGGNPIYTELANHPHDSWRWVYPDPQFVPWIYAQRLGVPWWTVSKAPVAPFTGNSPSATLTAGWPVTMPPANLPTSFGGASGSAAGASGAVGTGGVTGAGGANNGGMLGGTGTTSGSGGSGTGVGATGGSVASSTGGASSSSSGGTSPPASTTTTGGAGPVASGATGGSSTITLTGDVAGGVGSVASGSTGGSSGAKAAGSPSGGCSFGAERPGKMSVGSAVLLMSFLGFRRRQIRRADQRRTS